MIVFTSDYNASDGNLDPHVAGPAQNMGRHLASSASYCEFETASVDRKVTQHDFVEKVRQNRPISGRCQAKM
jgi:hypothetical protein